MNHPPNDTPPTTLDWGVKLDWPAVTRALNTTADAFRETMKAAARACDNMAATIVALANDPVRVAGIEGKWMARGGLDPAYLYADNASVAARMLTLGKHPDTVLLNRHNRALVAASFMHGWVTTRHPAELRAIANEPTPVFDTLVGAA